MSYKVIKRDMDQYCAEVIVVVWGVITPDLLWELVTRAGTTAVNSIPEDKRKFRDVCVDVYPNIWLYKLENYDEAVVKCSHVYLEENLNISRKEAFSDPYQ